MSSTGILGVEQLGELVLGGSGIHITTPVDAGEDCWDPDTDATTVWLADLDATTVWADDTDASTNWVRVPAEEC